MQPFTAALPQHSCPRRWAPWLLPSIAAFLLVGFLGGVACSDTKTTPAAESLTPTSTSTESATRVSPSAASSAASPTPGAAESAATMLSPGTTTVVYTGQSNIPLSKLLEPLADRYGSVTLTNPGGQPVEYLPGRTTLEPVVLPNAELVIDATADAPLPADLRPKDGP